MNKEFEYIILGAGPAGLQMGFFLKKNGRRFLILDRAVTPGSFFEEYPRHRQLLSINKVHTGVADSELNMRWDWNSLIGDGSEPRLSDFSSSYFPDREDLWKYLGAYAAHHDLPIQFETEIVQVSREADGKFRLVDGDGNSYQAKVLIVASGTPNEHIPDIPGIELCDTYGEHSLELSEYENKRVLILGKGNSGFETAEHLIETASVIHMVSPEPVRMAWKSHFVGHLRAVNNNFLDTYQLKSQNAVIDGHVARVQKMDDQYEVEIHYSHAMGQTTTRKYDRVIVCTGFQFDSSIFDEAIRPELTHNDRFPAQTSSWESSNVPDMFFAGTLMQSCDFKKTQSAFIHGFRNNIRALSWLLEERYHDQPWPAQTLDATPEKVIEKLVERMGRGAGIFQQPGFLCEALVVDEAEHTARHYIEVRRDHAQVSRLASEPHYYLVTLEYGHQDSDPFSVERDPDPMKGDEAFYLHPVVRRFDRDQLVATHHVNDDLENEWDRPEYVEPLADFVKEQFDLMRQPAKSMMG